MENQHAYDHTEMQGAPQEPELSTAGQPMSRRRFLGAIGAITAAAATGVLTNACRRDEQGTGEPAATEQKLEKQPESRELSPEQAGKIIDLLKTRSQAEKNKNLCPDLDFGRAERALTPEVLLKVHKAELEGHEPTIYLSDETGFDIGTRTDETPQSTRDCVLDKEAVKWAKENFPREQFNGSAEEQAKAIGWQLMTIDQGKHIAKNTEPYFEQGWSYYRTPEDIRKAGNALYGYRYGDDLRVFQRYAYRHNHRRGWRGTLRVDFVD